MRFIDLFSGIGAFRKGFELAGMTCVGHCEIDKFADSSYRAMFDVREDEWYGRDIKAVKSDEIPTADLWCAGFPCQDISVAGKGKGLGGERSGLFFKITRLIAGKAPEDRPRWIVLENVRNLLYINKGWDFARILSEVVALGYDIEYGLLNSKHFGVPHNRERVFIIAHRHTGTEPRRKVFPIEAGDGKALIQRLTDKSRCLAAGYAKDISNRSAESSGAFFGCARAVISPEKATVRQNGRRIKETNEPAFCLTAQDRHGVLLRRCESCIKVKSGVKCGFETAGVGDVVNLAFPDSETRRGRVGREAAKTLDTSCNQGVVTGCLRIRRLIPLECFRLQGFPDEMFYAAQSVSSESQLYKQAGNSVTVPVVYTIGKRIMKVEAEK